MKAGAAFQSAIRLEPDVASAHEGLGLVLSKEKRNAAAEAEYREAVRLEPGNGLACCRWGNRSTRRDGIWKRRSRSATPSAPVPAWRQRTHGLGWALHQLRENAEAEKALRDGIALDADSADGHMGLGAVLWDVKRYAEAEAEFEEAIRIDPSNAGPHRSLGRLLSSMNRHPEAQAEFREAIRLEPGNVGAQQDLAGMERDIGHLKKAGHDRITTFERRERRQGPERGRRVTTSPAILLRSPRARALRRFLAGLVDVCLIPAYSVVSLIALGYGSVVIGVGLYALNGYLEGTTGQSVGKMLTGLHTIDGKTGKFIGGGKGVLRRVLHVVDCFTGVGFLVGLIAGQTYADMLTGTVVVRRPTWVTAKSKRKMAALERADYRRLRRRTGLLLYLLALIMPQLRACGPLPPLPVPVTPALQR